MILKNIVKENNNVAYKIIKNAYENNRLSHNYLISSHHFADNDYFLHFIAQSLICKNGFACGKCNECKRVASEIFTDLIVVDGREVTIKKEIVIMAIDKLHKTALEKTKTKILLIKNIENSSINAINSLLKFVEEPPDNTYIIASTNSINNVFTTIKSRSQIITLNQISKDQIIKKLLDHNIKKEDAYILSSLFSFEKTALDFYESNDYKKCKETILTFFTKWISNIDDSKLYLLTTDEKIIGSKIFLKIFLIFLNDIWLQKLNEKIIFSNSKKIILKLIEAKFPIYKWIEETSKLMIYITNCSNNQLQIFSWITKVFWGKDVI